MAAAALAFDFNILLKDVPKGAWVAISEDQKRVIAYGFEMHTVLEDAERLGEVEPLILRVPEENLTLLL